MRIVERQTNDGVNDKLLYACINARAWMSADTHNGKSITAENIVRMLETAISMTEVEKEEAIK